MDEQQRQQAIEDHRLGRNFVDLSEPSGPSPSRSVVYLNDLDTSWAYLRSWLENFAKSTAPIGVTDCIFKPLADRPRLDGRYFEFAIVGTNQAGIAFPLVELAISAGSERCSLRLRYNAPAFVGYLRGLLLAIVEHWPEKKREIERAISRLPQVATVAVASVTLTPAKPATPEPILPTDDAGANESETRGAKAGTFERVQEAHRLLKTSGNSRAWVFKTAHTDSRTYNRWCKSATGEEPILPYSE